MAIFEGTIQEFHHYLGPRLKNAVNAFAKRERDARNGVCEGCGETFRELDSAHVHGRGRRTIIEEVISGLDTGNGVVRCEIKSIEKQILSKHKPISDVFKFLCKACHSKYDSAPGAVAASATSHTSLQSSSSGDDGIWKSNEVELLFSPADEVTFKQRLIEQKRAYFRLYKCDGRAEPIRKWNAQNFKDASNLRGNIFTGQLRNWRQKGIIKAVFAIDRSNLLDSASSNSPNNL